MGVVADATFELFADIVGANSRYLSRGRQSQVLSGRGIVESCRPPSRRRPDPQPPVSIGRIARLHCAKIVLLGRCSSEPRAGPFREFEQVESLVRLRQHPDRQRDERPRCQDHEQAEHSAQADWRRRRGRISLVIEQTHLLRGEGHVVRLAHPAPLAKQLTYNSDGVVAPIHAWQHRNVACLTNPRRNKQRWPGRTRFRFDAMCDFHLGPRTGLLHLTNPPMHPLTRTLLFARGSYDAAWGFDSTAASKQPSCRGTGSCA